MAIDENSPHISIPIDTEPFKKGLEKMDADYEDFIGGLKKKRDTFPNPIQMRSVRKIQ